MIKPGASIYIDLRTNRLYSRRSKNRTFLGWSYNNKKELEEGCMIHPKEKVLTDPKGFGMEYNEEEGDFKIMLYKKMPSPFGDPLEKIAEFLERKKND